MKEVSNKDFEEALADINNITIAKFAINQYKTIPVDDREQLINLAIWEALRRFDPSRKCKFTSYLYTCASWVCKNHIKRVKSKIPTVSLSDKNTKFYGSYEFDTRQIDMKYDLGQDDYQLIQERFINCSFLKEIAEKRKISIEWARMKVERAVDRAKN